MTDKKPTINPYDKEVCMQLVEKKYKQLIKQKYGNYVHLCFDSIYTWTDILGDTPRLRTITGQIPCATFYYTEFLVNIKPDNIYDIGCGMNFFKDVLPNVIGIDGNDPVDRNISDAAKYDIKGVFDDVFVAEHENQFQAVMSIDALHFIPLTDFTQRVLDFARIIKPRGRGYLAMNAARMCECTNKAVLLQLTGSAKRDANLISQYIDREICKLPLDFLVVDTLVDKQSDEYMDGNIRLVIQK
tara:strand:- start:132 stop:860 length:729 start_codon:yes stop_codon:yes gene_type:complete